MPDKEFRVGESIENRYRVLSVIGSGGMGTLYRVADEAHHDGAQAGEIVALKTIRLDAPATQAPDSVQRFQREFQLLTQLQHPNLVPVHDYGITSEGQLYFTMEWIKGRDLNPDRRPLAPAATIPVMVQICRALAYLHARGVVHGDLKPQNVLLVAEAGDAPEAVKILDFGVAMEVRSSEVRALYYSPGYSAPEVKGGYVTDHRADLYSLGAMWYALLVGRPPQFMPGMERLIPFTLDEALEVQDQVPAEIGALISRLLATEPQDRYAGANEVIEAVNEVTGSVYALETRETAGSYALRTRFVNREVEVDLLQTLWKGAQDSEGKVVLVSGEGGVGKTRLVAELEVQAEMEGARVVWGQCVESGGDAYQPWREVLRVLVRYVESTDEATMQGLGPVLAALLPELWERDYMAGLAPAAELEPQAAQLRLNNTIVKVMRTAAGLRPTVIVVENVHWADEATLELLSYLVRVAGAVGLLTCVTYRDDEVHSEHLLEQLAGERVQRVRMRGLSPEVTTDLVRSMLGLEELPTLLTERVQRTTGGNAFFVQELIRSLAAEEEVLQRTVEGWRVDGEALQAAQLPESIRQLVERRLVQLSEDARRVLEWAAVVGLVFWEGSVAEAGQEARARVRVALGELMEQSLIAERDETAFVGEREYLFFNPMVREVSYESIAREARRANHDRVAAWLVAHSEGEAGVYLGLIAEHLEKAGQTEQALIYLQRAGEQAAQRFANVEAIDYYSRALELISEDDLQQRYVILLGREKVYHLRWTEVEAQHQDLLLLEELAAVLDDDAQPGGVGSRRTEIALRLANYNEVIGDFPAAITAVHQAVGLAQASQDVNKEAAGYVQWGRILWSKGDYQGARARLEQALTLTQDTHLRQVTSDSLRELGRVSHYQSDYVAGTAYSERALHICREIGDRRGEAETLNNLGIISWGQGDYATAMVYFEQSGFICREIGDRRGDGRSRHNVGLVSMSLGDYVKGRDHFLEDLRLSRETGERMGTNISLCNCSLISHHLGDYEAARDLAQQALSMTRETGDRSVQGYALTNLGHALEALGDLAQAADVYQEALDIRRKVGDHDLSMESLAGLARVILAQGDLLPAQAHVEEILNYLEDQDYFVYGADEPFWVHLTCYRVLHATRDPRAAAFLDKTYHLLQEQAAKISNEEQRRSFLENVAAHREIVEAWENR